MKIENRTSVSLTVNFDDNVTVTIEGGEILHAPTVGRAVMNFDKTEGPAKNATRAMESITEASRPSIPA